MEATQLSLLGRSTAGPTADPTFGTLKRTDLGAGAWVDYAPRWLSGDDEVLGALRAAAQWSGGRRLMYERFVDVPRLIAPLPRAGGHPIVRRISELLARRYHEPFDSISLGLYRDGRDSVAYHQDKGLREQPSSVLAIVSVGDPRPFRLRPIGGGASLSFRCGWGDLVVMGGTIQRNWEHGVPKVAHAGPRMAIMFRRHRDTRLA